MSKMVLATRVDSILDSMVPGAFRFYTKEYGSKEIGGMNIRCPCGCGDGFALWFTGEKRKWTWNGSRDKPTLTPSVFMNEYCGWHGFLTDGVWIG